MRATFSRAWLPGWALLVGALVGAGSVGAFLGLRSPSAELELSPPTGRHSVGRTSFHWVDSSREQPEGEPSAKCELVVHLWYPAVWPQGEATAVYIPGFAALEAAWGQLALRAALENFYEGFRSARTHAVENAPLVPRAGNLPVVMLTHGLRYSCLGYSALGEDLASHGYVVVGVEHPSTAFAVVYPGSRIVTFSEDVWSRPRSPEETRAFEQARVDTCSADLRFVLDRVEELHSGDIASQFSQRLDLNRVGVFGHSFGGRVAARACQLDARFRVAVIADALGRTATIERRDDGTTLDQPVMLLAARRVPRAGPAREAALRQTPGEDLEQVLASIREDFCRSVRGGCAELVLDTPGIVHESFSDLPLLERGLSASVLAQRQRTLAIVRSYARAFLDRHLRGQPTPLLDEAPDESGEIQLRHHNAARKCSAAP